MLNQEVRWNGTKKQPMNIQESVKGVLMRALFRRLGHYAPITEREWNLFSAMKVETKEVDAHKDMIDEGEELKHVLIVEDGWCMRHRVLEDGRRQIVNFLLPGDFFDLQVFLARKSDHGISTVTPATIHFIQPKDILNVFKSSSELSLALWWATLQEEAVLREQIVRTGRRTAKERVAHIILELHRRNRIVHQGSESSFVLPLTQSILADALGLSLVHVNRTLRSLIRTKMIERNGSEIVIKDRQALGDLCDFDTNYLHLDASLDHFQIKFPWA